MSATDARVAVDVDLIALAAHLSAEDQRRVSIAECRRWLRDAGFEPHAGRWLVAERDLGQLDPSEVRSVGPAAAPAGMLQPVVTLSLHLRFIAPRRRRRSRHPLARPPRRRAPAHRTM